MKPVFPPYPVFDLMRFRQKGDVFVAGFKIEALAGDQVAIVYDYLMAMINNHGRRFIILSFDGMKSLDARAAAAIVVWLAEVRSRSRNGLRIRIACTGGLGDVLNDVFRTHPDLGPHDSEDEAIHELNRDAGFFPPRWQEVKAAA